VLTKRQQRTVHYFLISGVKRCTKVSCVRMFLSNEEVYYFNKLVTNAEPKTNHPLLFCYCIKLLATTMHHSKRSVFRRIRKIVKSQS